MTAIQKTKLRALIVEDDPMLQFLTKKQLEKIGVNSHVACNGVEAVSMLAEKFDIIFMDVSMPQMDGFETTRAFRAHEAKTGCARTVIVGLTAFSERERCIASGMDDFVQKPMMRKRLDELASRYLTACSNNIDVQSDDTACMSDQPSS